MNKNIREDYIHRIQDLSQATQVIESHILQSGIEVDISTIQQLVRTSIDQELRWDIFPALEVIQRYYQSIEKFFSQYGNETINNQIGRLFGFRPNKLIGDSYINQWWPFLRISFSEMQDLLSVKFAKRKDIFAQEDKASWFFKILHFEWYEIPVCVSIQGSLNESTIIHELTHFRNNLIWMSYYAQWWWIDTYEQVVYDDLQEEILAFFSEGMWRADIILAIWNDPRYHFYRRLENKDDQLYYRFMKDLLSFINIARAIKDLRPDSYLYDLALIPIKKWRRYLKYIESWITKKPKI